jgi:hypothetical protein
MASNAQAAIPLGLSHASCVADTLADTALFLLNLAKVQREIQT